MVKCRVPTKVLQLPWKRIFSPERVQPYMVKETYKRVNIRQYFIWMFMFFFFFERMDVHVSLNGKRKKNLILTVMLIIFKKITWYPFSELT